MKNTRHNQDGGAVKAPLTAHCVGKNKDMKTYPILRDDGTLHGFEIDNTWIYFETLRKILYSVDGVSDVRRVDFSDDRMEFLFHGEQCVVHEPFGDNSRYWIGPRNAANSTLDISPFDDAIAAYNSPVTKVLNFFRIS